MVSPEGAGLPPVPFTAFPLSENPRTPCNARHDVAPRTPSSLMNRLRCINCPLREALGSYIRKSQLCSPNFLKPLFRLACGGEAFRHISAIRDPMVRFDGTLRGTCRLPSRVELNS